MQTPLTKCISGFSRAKSLTSRNACLSFSPDRPSSSLCRIPLPPRLKRFTITVLTPNDLYSSNVCLSPPRFFAVNINTTAKRSGPSISNAFRMVLPARSQEPGRPVSQSWIPGSLPRRGTWSALMPMLLKMSMSSSVTNVPFVRMFTSVPLNLHLRARSCMFSSNVGSPPEKEMLPTSACFRMRLNVRPASLLSAGWHPEGRQ